MTLATGFGVTGDGRTDDTAALQHAIDAGGGVLQLAKGTYRLSRSLELDATRLGYVGIRGEQGASRLLMAAAGPVITAARRPRPTFNRTLGNGNVCRSSRELKLWVPTAWPMGFA